MLLITCWKENELVNNPPGLHILASLQLAQTFLLSSRHCSFSLPNATMTFFCVPTRVVLYHVHKRVEYAPLSDYFSRLQCTAHTVLAPFFVR